MSNPLTDIVMAAANVKAANGPAYTALLNAIRVHEANLIVQMVDCEKTRQLVRLQGQVKAVQQLRKHLAECSELKDTYVRRQGNGRPSTVPA